MLVKIRKYFLEIIVLGIVIPVAIYYFVESKEILPRYAVREPELLAETTDDAPELELFWQDKKIENIYWTSVVIWNAGRQYLDKNSISTTDSIRVIYPEDVKILYAKFIKTSRSNLRFTTADLATQGTNAIQIDIVGDEALERGEGGLLKILYTGSGNTEFIVVGRIKGSPEGFVETDWATVNESSSLSFVGDGLTLLGYGALTYFGIKVMVSRFRGASSRIEKLFEGLVALILLYPLIMTGKAVVSIVHGLIYASPLGLL